MKRLDTRLGTPTAARLAIRLLAGLLAGLAAWLAILSAASSQVYAQTQGAAAPAFEVATIKPWGDTVTIGGGTAPRAQFHYVHPNSTNPLRGISGNRFTMPIAALTDLIIDAYNVRLDQVSGAPRWATQDGDLYEINAKAEGEGSLTPDQVRQMLQTLLADRFQLKMHRETRSLPVYELTIGKNGPKIKEVPEGAALPKNGAPKRLLLNIISNFLDYPLVDKTGLNGANYQFDWDQTDLVEELKQGKPAPSIFGAVQAQLGLKLEKTNAPAEVLVIDHVEKPSEN